MNNQTNSLTVDTLTKTNMVNELNNFKTALLLAIKTGSTLPHNNTNDILSKYVKLATSELKKSNNTFVAKRIAKYTLTKLFDEVMQEA